MTFIGGNGDAPAGYVWVATSRDELGELTDWHLVAVEVAAHWDVRRWRPLP